MVTGVVVTNAQVKLPNRRHKQIYELGQEISQLRASGQHDEHKRAMEKLKGKLAEANEVTKRNQQ